MILGKIIRSGGLVASGVLLGSLLSYNSEKTEIFSGIESLKTSAIEAKSNEAKILEQKKKLEQSLTDLTTNLENAREKIEVLTIERDSYKERIERLEAEVNSLLAEGSKEDLKNEIKKLTSIVEGLDAKINAQEILISDLTNSIETKQNEIDRLNDLIAFKDKLYVQTYMKAIEYEEQIEDLREIINSKDKVIERLQSELDKLQSNNSNIDSENSTLKSQIENLNEQINALNREKSQLESTIETLNTIVSQLKSDYANMSEKYNASQQELNDLRSEMNDSQNESNTLLNKANAEIKKANQDQNDILEAIENAKEEIANY